MKMDNSKIVILLIFFWCILLFTACEQFDYNVYQTNRYDPPAEAATSYNIEQLQKLPWTDTLRVIFTGDPQRYYDDLEEMVEKINQVPNLDAVFVAGDLVEFSLANEYQWVCEQLVRLYPPFLTVIGNHDCLAKGREMYTDIYGPLNYSFDWNGIRFIMHNTNSREFNFNGTVPDLSWMQQQLEVDDNYNHVIFMSHVPSDNVDFDPALVEDYKQIIRNTKSTILSVNGHRHNYALTQTYNDGIWYLNTSSPGNGYYAYVEIYPNAVTEPKFKCTLVPF